MILCAMPSAQPPPEAALQCSGGTGATGATHRLLTSCAACQWQLSCQQHSRLPRGWCPSGNGWAILLNSFDAACTAQLPYSH